MTKKETEKMLLDNITQAIERSEKESNDGKAQTQFFITVTIFASILIGIFGVLSAIDKVSFFGPAAGVAELLMGGWTAWYKSRIPWVKYSANNDSLYKLKFLIFDYKMRMGIFYEKDNALQILNEEFRKISDTQHNTLSEATQKALTDFLQAYAAKK